MRVLGIDPGVAITGYGLVEGSGDDACLVASGVIRTVSTSTLSERLLALHEELFQLIQRYRPQEAAIEEFFFGRNTRTALAVGYGRGVTLLTLARAGLAVCEYTPLEVKLAVAGYGRATKAQVQEMVRLLLHLEAPPRPDDAADAVAVALCHLQSSRFSALLSTAEGQA